MGTPLTGTTPQDTYDSLIKVTDNGPLTGSLKVLTDGLGNESTLSLSTTAASIAGTLAVTGNATFDTSTLFVDAAANEVGIGTITPAAKLDINQTNQLGANDFIRLTTAATTGTLSLGVYPSSNNSLSFIGSNALYSAGGITRLNASAGGSILALNTDSIIMYVSSGAADPVERAAFTANGLTFNGDTAAANALDDYEEGTWTMGIAFGGNAVGVTTSLNTGTYTKIGRKVTINGLLALTSKGSSTGSARLTGLPFVVGSGNDNYGAAALRFNNITFTNQFQGYGAINTSTIEFEEITILGVVTSITNADFANNSEVLISLTYFV